MNNIIKKFILKNYYKLLSDAFHIPKEETVDEREEKEEKVSSTHKIDRLLNNMKEKFKDFYEIGNKVTIDEAMIPSKSRQETKFYLPMKHIKFVFKLLYLCDFEINYFHNYIFYQN